MTRSDLKTYTCVSVVHMTDFVGRARAFVKARYPQAIAAFLGGSAASGEATESSDLDILIVLPDRWTSVGFVETTEFDGQIVEAFVYGREALQSWMAKGRSDALPVLDRLVAGGVSLVTGEISTSIAAISREALRGGPAPIAQEELNRRRYSLSAVMDDVTDAMDPGIRCVAMVTAWKEAAELALLSNAHWLGTGKWLVRELRANGDPFGLAALAVAGWSDEKALVDACDAVLESTGGYLQIGFTRGTKPKDL